MLSRMADIAITGGLRDCSLAEIFISVLERARGSGGVKLPPLRLMPEHSVDNNMRSVRALARSTGMSRFDFLSW